jgi:hypothetical protein
MFAMLDGKPRGIHTFGPHRGVPRLNDPSIGHELDYPSGDLSAEALERTPGLRFDLSRKSARKRGELLRVR